MFEEHGLGYYGAEAAASCKTGGGREEMDEKDHEIAHFRIVARNRKLAEFRAISNSPWTGSSTGNLPDGVLLYVELFDF